MYLCSSDPEFTTCTKEQMFQKAGCQKQSFILSSNESVKLQAHLNTVEPRRYVFEGTVGNKRIRDGKRKSRKTGKTTKYLVVQNFISMLTREKTVQRCLVLLLMSEQHEKFFEHLQSHILFINLVPPRPTPDKRSLTAIPSRDCRRLRRRLRAILQNHWHSVGPPWLVVNGRTPCESRTTPESGSTTQPRSSRRIETRSWGRRHPQKCNQRM